MTVAVAMATTGSAAPAAAQEAPANQNKTLNNVPANKFQADQDRLNATLAKGHPFTDRAIILDPDLFDYYVGMGRSSLGAVTKMLADEGFKNPDPLLLKGIVRQFLEPTLSTDGLPVLTTSAQTFHVVERRVCIVTPLRENTLTAAAPTLPDGVSRKDFIHYGNQHEFSHVLDPVTDFSKLEPYMGTINHTAFRNMPWAFPGVLEAYASVHRAEVLGDVVTLGNAVRGGASVSVIQSYSDWRQSYAALDPLHASTLALRELQKEIGRRGMKAFRAMNDDEAQALYIDISGRTGLSEPLTLQRTVNCLDSREQMEALKAEAATDPGAARGLSACVMLEHRERMAWTIPQKTEIHAEYLKDWDAAKILRQETAARHHAIMPATTYKTYAVLRDGLRRQAEKDPDGAELYAEQGARLRTAFLKVARGIDVTLDKETGAAKIVRPAAPKP